MRSQELDMYGSDLRILTKSMVEISGPWFLWFILGSQNILFRSQDLSDIYGSDLRSSRSMDLVSWSLVYMDQIWWILYIYGPIMRAIWNFRDLRQQYWPSLVLGLWIRYEDPRVLELRTEDLWIESDDLRVYGIESWFKLEDIRNLWSWELRVHWVNLRIIGFKELRAQSLAGKCEDHRVYGIESQGTMG